MNTADLELFIRIADNQSITLAAQQLDITAAAASAALKRLEKQLNVQLFIRSTRQLRITAEGERFLLHSRQVINALNEGLQSLNSIKDEISGELRLSVPSDLGRNILLPWIDEMMDSHSRLSVQLNVSDTLADFYQDRVDLVLRYGQPQDSSLVAFSIAKINRITCASPAYLKLFGTPKVPQDLLNHNCLIYRLGNRVYDNWEFQQKNRLCKIQVSSNRVCNDGDIVRRWVTAGRGIAYKSQLDMSTDLKLGHAVEILSPYKTQTELFMVCPNRKSVTPAVLALRDMLRSKISEVLSSNK